LWHLGSAEHFGDYAVQERELAVNKGFMLVTVLAVLLAVSLGCLAMLQTVTIHASLKAKSVKELIAQSLAEAGMWYALWKCKKDPSACAGPITLDESGSEIVITKEDSLGGTSKIEVAVTYSDE